MSVRIWTLIAIVTLVACAAHADTDGLSDFVVHKIKDDGQLLYIEEKDGMKVAFLYDRCGNMVVAIQGDGTVRQFPPIEECVPPPPE